MRTNPHILEINTRLWLKRLETKHGQQFTLDTVPVSYWQDYKALGFDAIWLLGVWKTGFKSKEIAQNFPDINESIAKVYPQYSREDIAASPFSIYDYSVADDLGGDDGILKLKETLNGLGISLLLDYVGNHLAVDHPKTISNPDFFINTGTNEPPEDKKSWFFKTENGVYIAHGKDPYFPSWTDTSQLNYFNPDARRYMLDCLKQVAALCDGVRCDMAMLSLNKVHSDIWGQFLGGYPAPQDEFWKEAVSQIREIKPDFVFIAEVYWGLEWEIQEMGFDYTYDKILYDRLRYSTAENIKGHLTAEHLYQKRSIRFIANHDEEVAIKAFGREKSFAAAALISTISGARMYHLFQLCGRKAQMPIQYMADPFDEDDSVFDFYKRLLTEVNAPAYHGGQWALKDVDSADNNGEFKNVLCWVWTQSNTHKMVIINYCNCMSSCFLDVRKLNADAAEESFATHPVTGSLSEWLKNKVTLQPFEIKIITL